MRRRLLVTMVISGWITVILVLKSPRRAEKMNHSEYLRRKLERLPVVYGPSRLGDESMRIMETRFKASVRRPVGPPPVTTCCRGPTPYWRSGGGRPDVGPYPRVADGQQQEWSSEGVVSSKAGCAVCSAGRAGYIFKACCPPEPTPEARLDPSKKAYALRGKVTCCPVVGPTLQSLPPDCGCAKRSAAGRQNTLLANNMPSDKIPYPVPIRNCRTCPPIDTTGVCVCSTC